MAKKKLPYEEWLKEVAKLLKCKVSDFTGENSFREEYDQDLTPKQAAGTLYQND